MRDGKSNSESSAVREVSINGSLSRRQFRSIMAMLLGAAVFVAGLILDPMLSILLSGQRIEGQFDAASGYAALAMAIAGLSVLFAGATVILADRSMYQTSEGISSVFSTLSRVLSKRSYSRILLVSAALYGVLYSLASGIIVYDPALSFSTVYHVSIPSSAVATCCSGLGETPLAVVYLTEHVGLLLVPVNLLLLFSVSWLVGLNAALGAFVLSLRITNRGIGWLGGAGALAGLFTACPTCAGLAIFYILGGTGTLSVALLLGPLQTIFVGISIPMLVATPILSARSIRSFGGGVCTRR